MLINIYIEKEKQRLADEEAERRKKELEEAMSKAPQQDLGIPEEPPRRQPEPQRVQVGTGRAVSQRVRKELVWEGDETKSRIAALKVFLDNTETLRPDLAGIIDTMARNMLENGMKVPGASLKDISGAV